MARFYLYTPVRTSRRKAVQERLGEYRVIKAQLCVSDLAGALALAESKRLDLQEAGASKEVLAQMRLTTVS